MLCRMKNPTDEVFLNAASIYNRFGIVENFAFTIDTSKYKVLPIGQIFGNPASCLWEALWTLGIVNSFNLAEPAFKNKCKLYYALTAIDGVIEDLYSDRFRNTFSPYADETDQILRVLDRLKEADNLSIPFPLVKCTDDEHRRCDDLQPTMVTFIVRTKNGQRFLDIHIQQQECKLHFRLASLLNVWLYVLKVTARILNCETGKLMGNILKITSDADFVAEVPALFKISRLRDYEKSVEKFLEGGKECFYDFSEESDNRTYNDWEKFCEENEFSCPVPDSYLSWDFAKYNDCVSQ